MKDKNNCLMIWASFASIGVAFTLIACKAVAYFMTGSIAILSTLFDSIQDLMTSGVNLTAVHHAVQPADKQHRFGHGKAQAIGGLVQAVIIFLSAVMLMIQSIQRLTKNTIPDQLAVGFVILTIALILTFLLLTFQKYVIRKTNSLSIQADMAHYTGDIWMDIGVMLSLIISNFCQTGWIDALFGVGVGLYLCWVTYQIALSSIHILMDREMPQSIRQKIKKIVLQNKQIKGIHDLRTRQSGSCVFIQMTLLMDGKMTLNEAHAVADEVEQNLQQYMVDSQIILHLEPFQK